MNKRLSMKVCSLDKKPICELLDNTPFRARNAHLTRSINEITGLTFDIPCKNKKWYNLSNESLVLFNDEYYSVKNLNFIHTNDNKLMLSVETKHLSNQLAEQLVSLPEIEPMNIIDLMKVALCYDAEGNPTLGWSLGSISMDVDHVKMRGLEGGEQSPYSFIMTIMEKYDAIPIFDSKKMVVNVIAQKKQDHPTLDLRVSKNLKEINITYDTSEMVTKLYGYGAVDKDGNELDIMSINPSGLPYVTNYDYFIKKGYTQEVINNNLHMFTKVNIYRESSIYDPQDLYDNTVEQLKKVSQPKVDVQIQALNTKKVTSNNIVNVDLGDCVLVHDEDLDMDFVCNVTKREIDYEQPHLLTVELVNSVVYKDTLAELFNSVNNPSSVIHGGSGNDSWKGNVTVGDIKDLHLYYLSAEQIEAKYITADEIKANYITSEYLKANYIDAESIGAKYATIDNLNAVEAKIQNLDVDKINAEFAKIQQLLVDYGEFHKLVATEAEIEELKANNITVAGKLKADKAEIEELIATKVTAGDFEAYKATIEQLFALYATIEHLEAEYIKASQIEAEYAKIGELDVVKGNFDTLKAKVIEVENLVADKASIKDLEAINATIETLTADFAKIEELVATKVDAEYVKAQIVEANKIIVEDLQAIHAIVDVLEAKYATIEYLDAEIIKVNELIAKKATIEELEAAVANIGELNALVANINSILAGNIGTGILQTIHLTAKNMVVDDAVIKSAMIADLDVSKLKAGTISTNKFVIKSDNGGILVQGSTMQFKDKNNKVRLQVGQDAQGNFNFIVFGEDGTTAIYDENGITKNAVPDGLIVDEMINDDAGIQGKKLDIDSVIETINEDGTKTIKGSKIWIDETNQSLGASFKEVNTKVDNIKVGAVNLIRNAKTMIFDGYGIRGYINKNTYIVDENGNRLTDELLNSLIF